MALPLKVFTHSNFQQRVHLPVTIPLFFGYFSHSWCREHLWRVKQIHIWNPKMAIHTCLPPMKDELKKTSCSSLPTEGVDDPVNGARDTSQISRSMYQHWFHNYSKSDHTKSMPIKLTVAKLIFRFCTSYLQDLKGCHVSWINSKLFNYAPSALDIS